MKTPILFLIAAQLLICSANTLDENFVAKREKRGIFTCSSKIPEVVKKCAQVLDDELDLDDKIAKEMDGETPGQFKCCYFAKFNYCLRSNLEDECGDFAKLATETFSGAAKFLQPKCEGYDYPSATCIVIVWLYYIIAAVVIFFLISFACCIARCICGRK